MRNLATSSCFKTFEGTMRTRVHSGEELELTTQFLCKRSQRSKHFSFLKVTNGFSLKLFHGIECFPYSKLRTLSILEVEVKILQLNSEHLSLSHKKDVTTVTSFLSKNREHLGQAARQGPDL